MGVSQQDCIQVDTLKLLERLCENRARHAGEVTQSIKGWRTRYCDVFRSELDRLSSLLDDVGSSLELDYNECRLNLPSRPIPHMDEYDAAIIRLEMYNGENYAVSAEQFDCWAVDQWDWSARHRSELAANTKAAMVAK